MIPMGNKVSWQLAVGSWQIGSRKRMVPMGNTFEKRGTMIDRVSKIFAGSRVHLQCGNKE